MRSTGESPKFPCSMIILFALLVALLLALFYVTGGNLSSLQNIGKPGYGAGLIEQFTGGLRALGQGIVDVFNDLLH